MSPAAADADMTSMSASTRPISNPGGAPKSCTSPYAAAPASSDPTLKMTVPVTMDPQVDRVRAPPEDRPPARACRTRHRCAIPSARPARPSVPTVATETTTFTPTDEHRHNHRRPRVPVAVEGTRQHHVEAVRRQPEQEEQQRVGRLGASACSSNPPPKSTSTVWRRSTMPTDRRSRASRTAAAAASGAAATRTPRIVPAATARDIAGSRITPSGTPITPIGIWSTL